MIYFSNTHLEANKLIKLVSLFIAIVFLILLYQEFDMLKYLFDEEEKWDFSVVIYFFPFIILPLAGILFWFRKKIGWMLTAIYSTYSAANTVLLFIMEINREPTGIPALDILFPTISPITHLFMLLIYGGLIWAISKEDVRTIYNIDKRTMLITLSTVTAAILLIFMAFIL